MKTKTKTKTIGKCGIYGKDWDDCVCVGVPIKEGK